MDELAKMGFFHDVTHFDPDGKEVDSQRVHNLVPYEGCKFLLNKFFFPNGTWGTTTINQLNILNICFMKAMPELSKFDELEQVWQNFDEATEFTSTSRNRLNYNSDNIFQNLNTATNTLTFSRTKWEFAKPCLLTGIFIFYRTYSFWNSNTEDPRDAAGKALISESLFDNPIQMETNGSIVVSTSFAFTSQ